LLRYDGKHRLPVSENVLTRQFKQQGPNQARGSVITHLWTREGWNLLPTYVQDRL